ncbi:DUF6069 family protein [Actinomadura macrotermitis]|uniref:Uncharacterized protein n=1 Tax=Actinomadura macrotermitis TaxID=2585200 RepID=A0A7K0BN14_9ACTN|nr:DUF6069 family protein [Actinomadura macrotermitis]MQY02104.1 hypothetical protein [Actinomadura macrotermitis]
MTGPGPEGEPKIDALRLWGGGLATALVAALVAFLGVLITHGVLGVRLLVPEREEALADTAAGAYVLAAAAGALVTTLVLQLLVVLTARPMDFFARVTGLLTMVLTIAPFITGAALAREVATGLVNLFVGLTIASLLTQTGYAALRSGRTGDR